VELDHHLYYQELVTRRCSLQDAVQTFVKILTDRGITTADALAFQAEGAAAGQDATRYYRALAIKLLFDSFSDAEIRDYINLAHKEALARKISLLIHDDAVDLHQIEGALQEFESLPVGESQVSPNIAIGIRVKLVSVLISDNLFYIGVAKNHITMRDVAALPGTVLGKALQPVDAGRSTIQVLITVR